MLASRFWVLGSGQLDFNHLFSRPPRNCCPEKEATMRIASFFRWQLRPEGLPVGNIMLMHAAQFEGRQA